MKSFEEIWHSRNPQHELNADTGKDMFWGTAQLCAEEFCSQASDKDKEILTEQLEAAIQDYNDAKKEIERLKGKINAINIDYNAEVKRSADLLQAIFERTEELKRLKLHL